MRTIITGTLLAAGFLLTSLVKAEVKGNLPWQPWSDKIFADAVKEKKLVLLNLEAVWCHWCHVMAEETYGNPKIASLLKSKFILAKADQDANPDLGARYRDYGWPATILFDSKGQELRKLQGFIDPKEMTEVLEEVIKDPKPLAADAVTQTKHETLSSLPSDLRAKLEARHYKAIDTEVGGLVTSHRYLDPGSVEYALQRSLEGSKIDTDWVRKTLDANLALIDPVWGGVYQYSTKRAWTNAHFEKIMPSQAANISLYGLAFAQSGEKRYADAAMSIVKFLKTFLYSPDGAFYTSQDADVRPGEHSAEYFTLDDAGRRKEGIPRIDQNVYARENGLAIEALSNLYAYTGDEDLLATAVKAAKWIVANRSIDGGGFRHGEKDSGGPYLADSLAMARATLALYSVTGDRSWLAESRRTAEFMIKHFTETGNGGFASVDTQKKIGNISIAVRSLEENASLTRYLTSLFHYTGDEQYKSAAGKALAYIGEPKVAFDTLTEPLILLAGREFAADPAHLTIVGKKDDTLGKEMFKEALRIPLAYRRIEWWDRAEGPMPNPDVGYPKLPKVASFVCAQKRCSLPIFDMTELKSQIKRVIDATAKTVAGEAKAAE